MNAPVTTPRPIADCRLCLASKERGELPADHQHCLDTFACDGAKLNAAGGEFARVAAAELKKMRDNVGAFVRYLFK